MSNIVPRFSIFWCQLRRFSNHSRNITIATQNDMILNDDIKRSRNINDKERLSFKVNMHKPKVMLQDNLDDGLIPEYLDETYWFA